MADSFNLVRRIGSLDISPELAGYSGVVIYAGQDENGDNIEYRAGSTTGTVLEITNEWGSQEQADAIYRKILGFKYQPFKAGGTRIEPFAEIGDAVTMADMYGGIFSKATTFGGDIVSDLEAPTYEEIEHEFQVQSTSNRQYDRFTRTVRASLSLTSSKIAAEVEAREAQGQELRASLNMQAGQIAAKVSKTGGDPSSFGWVTDDHSWVASANNSEVFRLDKDGAKVTGVIRATSGKIGGFDIMSDYLSYNNMTWGGTNTTGAYIGRSGIQLGKNCKIDMQGHAEFESANIKGTIRAGDLIYGGNAGYLSGSGIGDHSLYGGKLAYNTISTSYTSSGINTSLGYADYASSVFNGLVTAPNVYANNVTATNSLYVPWNGRTRLVSVKEVTIDGYVYNILTI